MSTDWDKALDDANVDPGTQEWVTKGNVVHTKAVASGNLTVERVVGIFANEDLAVQAAYCHNKVLNASEEEPDEVTEFVNKVVHTVRDTLKDFRG